MTLCSCPQEQKAAREAAVVARRRALERARRLHVQTLLERRRQRDARVQELKGLKKQERDDAAREKVRLRRYTFGARLRKRFLNGDVRVRREKRVGSCGRQFINYY